MYMYVCVRVSMCVCLCMCMHVSSSYCHNGLLVTHELGQLMYG